MSDIIEDSRNSYSNLLNTTYHFALGRRGNFIEFDVAFSKEQHYHLMGFQHIEGNVLSVKNNKDNMFDQLANLDFRNELLNNEYFIEEQLEKRISVVANLEKLMGKIFNISNSIIY